MAGFRLIDICKPLLPILPEIELPYEKISFDDKVIYTVFIGLIYLFSQFPLAGLDKDYKPLINDPIYFMRSVFSAERGTLLEFGIFPIVSSALMLQLLAGLKYIKVNFKLNNDRELFQSLTKIFAIFQYFILTNIFIFAGYFGINLSIFQIILINFQLVGAGTFITLLIEIIDKGFGFSSGLMVINTIVIATNTVADTVGISQVKIDFEGNTEAQGSLINLLQSFRSKDKSILSSIISSFNRDYLPNLTTTLLVFIIGAIVCYYQSFRIELPIRSTRARGVNNVFPIRLFHVGSLSITFAYVILFYIHSLLFACIAILGGNNKDNIICKILGTYDNTSNGIIAIPSFPLSILTPPTSLLNGIISSPLSFIIFPSFILITAIWFANKWQDISGQSARDLAKEFKDEGITLTGRREQSIAKELNKVIPLASMTGAAVLSIITILGELYGLKGKAAGIVVGVSGGFAILELISVEYQQTGGDSALTSVLGVPTM